MLVRPLGQAAHAHGRAWP